MTADNYNPEWDDYDPAFLAFIARLDLNDTGTALSPPPPRTPSPTPESDAVHRHTFPSMNSRRSDSNTPNPTVYQFESPTRCGSTTHWSLAGSATQGVANAHVRAIQTGGRRKKPRTHIAAYTVFCGRQHGVFKTWAETEPLVKRVSKCIFRGYGTLAEARAAYEYAAARSWVRVADAPVIAAIPHLPQPQVASSANLTNPLNGNEDFNGRWFVVYAGITPGVYRSLLESQLNTLGVPGAIHESIVGWSAAWAKFTEATGRNETRVGPAPAYDDVFT
ncbi:hypothetical protein B0H13DRAFT_2261035 [Mycena leptocephala]|nr:hypothetical protein B0H13DRAFT_2287910 [Mycena leptocephala]KAJ7939408.1 hypothetical protein B0H13DRAFT_2261035 [Mycena leptocephala]